MSIEQEKITTVLNKIKRKLHTNQYYEAIKLCDKAISFNFIHPLLAEVYVLKSRLLNTIGENGSALECADNALAINSQQYMANYHKGMAFFGLKQYIEAEKQFFTALEWIDKEITELKCVTPTIYCSKAMILYMLDRCDEAEEYADKSVELDKNYPDGYYIKALILHEREAQDAIQTLNKAILLHESAVYLVERGHMQYENNNYEEARWSYLEALDVSLGFFLAYMAIGATYYKEGKYIEACKYYDKASKRNPVKPCPYFSKNLALQELNRYHEAMTCIDQALELEPLNETYLYHKGLLYFKLNNWSMAKKYSQMALELDPTNDTTLELLAHIYINLQQPNLGLKYFNNVIQLGPQDKDIQLLKKRLLSDTKGKRLYNK